MTLKQLLAFSGIVGALLGGLLAAQPAQAQFVRQFPPVIHWKKINIAFPRLKYNGEDDWFMGDEPYLIVTRFVAQLQVNSDGSMTLVPGTLSVSNTPHGGHKDLGHSDANWADEDNTYHLPSNLSINFSEMVPKGQPYWVVGAFVTMLEEDGFSDSTVRYMANLIQSKVHEALSTMNFQVGVGSIGDAVRKRILQELGTSFWNLATNQSVSSLTSLLRSILQAVDPDDFGGSNLVMAVTDTDNSLYTYIGGIPQNQGQLLGGLTKVASHLYGYIHYPSGDISSLPYRARYTGNCDFETYIGQ